MLNSVVQKKQYVYWMLSGLRLKLIVEAYTEGFVNLLQCLSKTKCFMETDYLGVFHSVCLMSINENLQPKIQYTCILVS